MRIVDLSHTIESLPDDLPAFMQVRVDYTDHKAGAADLEAAFWGPDPPHAQRRGTNW